MMVQRLPSNGWWHRSRGCGANIHSERTAKISRSVSVSKSHRQETRMDLPLSEPAAESESARENRNQPGQTGARRPAKRLWKRRSLRELGNPFGIPTFPQPQQQQTFSGYISNGATWIARVTFSNGLTRGLADINLVQQGAELSYLILHDPDFRRVRLEHLVETGRRIRLKHDVALFARVLDNLGEEHKFNFNVISAAPQEIVQSALEGIVPPDHIFGTR